MGDLAGRTDKANKDVIAQEEGIPAIIQGLRSPNDHVVLSTLVTLDFLVSPFNAQRTILSATPHPPQPWQAGSEFTPALLVRHWGGGVGQSQ